MVFVKFSAHRATLEKEKIILNVLPCINMS